MLGAVCGLHGLTHSVLTTTLWSWSCYYPHLQVRTLRSREVKLLAQGHSAWAQTRLPSGPQGPCFDLLSYTVSACGEEPLPSPVLQRRRLSHREMNTETQRVGGSWHVSHWWMLKAEAGSAGTLSPGVVLYPERGSIWRGNVDPGSDSLPRLAPSFWPWVLERLDFFFARLSQGYCPFLPSRGSDCAPSLSILFPCSASHRSSPPLPVA